MERISLRTAVALAATLLLAAATACGEKDTGPETAAARGALVYRNVCIACHNADPSKPGSLGPAIAGSSRQLIEARVVHGTYPDGYEPKQGGALMPKFPHLAGSVDDLAAYLAAPPGG